MDGIGDASGSSDYLTCMPIPAFPINAGSSAGKLEVHKENNERCHKNPLQYLFEVPLLRKSYLYYNFRVQFSISNSARIMTSPKKSSIINIGLPWDDPRLAGGPMTPEMLKRSIEEAVILIGKEGWKDGEGFISLQYVLLSLNHRVMI